MVAKARQVTLRFRRFQPDDFAGLQRLNTRLRAGNVHYPVYGDAPPDAADRTGPMEIP